MGPYQVQAAISALHAQAETPERTDWPQIAALPLHYHAGHLGAVHPLHAQLEQPVVQEDAVARLHVTARLG